MVQHGAEKRGRCNTGATTKTDKNETKQGKMKIAGRRIFTRFSAIFKVKLRMGLEPTTY